MNYYSHHIGDFDRATRHLTRTERSVYLDMLFVYYDTESPLTLDTASLCRKIMARSEDEKSAVLAVLDEFFHETPSGWFHDRCEEELDVYRKTKTQASVAGKASAAARAERRRLAMGESPTGNERRINENPTTVERPLSDRSTDDQQESNSAPTNQEPRTKNQEPIKVIEPTGSVNSDEKPSEIDEACEQKENQLKCPVGHIVDAYHASMPLNPQVRILNDARRKAISARWREAAKMDVGPFGYKTVAEGLAAWKEFFSICNDSLFLTGRAKAQQGKPPFLADIDFLMSPSGFVSALENKYHREVA